MSTPLAPLAMHGFYCEVPEEWDLVVNKGDWRGGHLVLSTNHTPMLNLSWDRRPRKPDFAQTLHAMGKRMAKDHQGTLVRSDELSGGRGLIARFESKDGLRHIGILRPNPDLAYTIIVRQLVPSSGEAMKRLAESFVVHPRDHQATPWHFHGLHLELDGFWQLTGVHHLIGMTRALWFHRPDPGKRPDALLVMRRYACASRMLKDQSLADWIAEHMDRKETITNCVVSDDGTVSVIAQSPGTWWNRLRRQPQIRHLHAWIEQTHTR